MLKIQNILEKSKDFEKIKQLYESAFPYKERLPIRDKGYSSKILQMIHEMKPQDLIIADIEIENSMADNNEQRTRRKNFYIRNGYQETDIFYTWHDVPYQILSYEGTVSQNEFISFWQHFEVEKNALT